MLKKVNVKHKIVIILVRTQEDLEKCDALIIPGGGAIFFFSLGLWPLSSFVFFADSRFLPESTTIALLARLAGLLEPLREFMKTKPIWGTCAGAILLSQEVENAKKGGQELLGAMSITIARNGWGSQVFTIRLGESLFLISVDRSSHLRHPWKLRDSVSPNDLSMAFLSGHR